MPATTCPISTDRIDRVVVRLTGGTMAALLVLHLTTGHLAPLLLAVLDYTHRASGIRSASPVSAIASRVAAALGTSPDPIDRAPKVFAARAGWTMATVGLVLTLAGAAWGPMVLAALAGLATLESVANLCLGCLIYSHLVLPLKVHLAAAAEVRPDVHRTAAGDVIPQFRSP